jgi:signal transduction histidine kinase
MPKKKATQLEKANTRLEKELLQKERALKIESSLEKVRVLALAMKERDDMLNICKLISSQLKILGVKEIRNVQTAIFYKEKGIYTNYEYYAKHKKTFITDTRFTDDPLHREFSGKMLKGKGEFFTRHINGKKVKEWLEEQKKTNVFIDKYLEKASSLTYYWFSLGPVALGISTYYPLTKSELDLFRRFVNVFQLAYLRYFDIENAEAQAREAKIQVSLEKVRAGSLAMQKSQELIVAGELLWNELRNLGIESLSSGYVIMDRDGEIGWTYAPNPATGKISDAIGLSNTQTKEMRAVRSAWQKKEPISIIEMNEEETIAHQTFVAENALQRDGSKFFWITAEQLIALSPKRLRLQNFNFEQGYLMIVGGNRLTEKEIEIMLRFTKVFQQTYTRFLDLQKAEEQAREAQIQVSLEKVRSRSLAMQKSTELSDAARVIFEQLQLLGENPMQSTIGIMNETDRVIEFSVTDWKGGGGQINELFKASFDEPSLINKSYNAWKGNKKSLVVDLKGADLDAWIDYRNKISGTTVTAQETSGRRVVNLAYFSRGHISFSTTEPRPEQSIQLLERFASEFDMTYTRFLDLQKAEEQARESQIEAALERVRSRSMAMRKSDELSEVIKIVYDQFVHLNIQIDHAGFVVDYKPKGDWHFWIADKQDIPSKISTPYFDSVWGIAFNEAIEKGVDFFTTYLNFEEKNKFYQQLLSYVPGIPEEAKNFYFNCPGVAASTVVSEMVSLYIENFSAKPYSEEENKILRRFGLVFQQTYTRFLDLQKAEAQAREVQIEASLERVRGHAMAMHNSDDVTATANLVFFELNKLGIQQIRSGVGMIDKETRNMHLYSATSSSEGSLALMGVLNLSGHEVMDEQFSSWLNHENYFTSLKGDALDAYYTNLSAGLGVPLKRQTDAEEEYGHWIMFSEGFLYAWSNRKYSDEEIKILERFKNVIELTFRRYSDLKKAEASTKEAVKQAALDRIRADIASMRTFSDLDRITPIIWNELKVLGLPFVRCGVFIMDDEKKQIHTFLSTPEGKAIAAFHLPYDTPGNFSDIVHHWHQKMIYVNHWDEKDFSGLADLLIQQGDVQSRDQYLSSIPAGGIWLHFLPFDQGMLYVGNTTNLNKEEMDIIQSIADAFSTAYARYEDFSKLEIAKKQVDSTLNELQATQKQLIQSEKMASLGELTAGIAHEIQNPLNFVNNFSEVSDELIEELFAERTKPKAERDEQLEDEILNNIRQNLEKINTHGKRADGIVKGMLQHSRSSTGKKEPTDINALVDEFLRLAYHGYRAKEKFFNVKMETDFDKGIDKIQVVTQDIGRVILNLINNAFYAVNDKKNSTTGDFEPAISVSTKKWDDRIEIRVKDNGNGVPQKIQDKIFQPFFTTKPTGQGTGLGLSLSYDILKSHGGEIKLHTEAGRFTEFVIELPC